jgi:DNA topoisomerase VI subunit B
MAQSLERSHFEISRAAEYFSAKELQAQTGQPEEKFATVALKELMDNALDACETAKVQPQLEINVDANAGLIQISVHDNGHGIDPAIIERILNFDTRTSDKSAYRAPTRGAQGNALKTVLGMPCALQGNTPVVIESRDVRHSIHAWIDPAGELRIDHEKSNGVSGPGTKVTVTLPAEDQEFDPDYWSQAFSLFNPHARISSFVPGIEKLIPKRTKTEILANRLRTSPASGGNFCRRTLPRRTGTALKTWLLCSSLMWRISGRAAKT